MAKEFKDWVDEFIENGANPKNVVNWPEETGGGGGTRVVSELPETGEEHIIYELQETSKASYGLMFALQPSMSTPSGYFLVFDTYEQMTTTINAIKIDENTVDDAYYSYIRNENKVYFFHLHFQEDGPTYWEFEEQQKKEDESGTDYAFQLVTLKDNQTFYILKEFVGNERPIVDGGWEYSCLTLDNKEVYLGHTGVGLILRDIVHPKGAIANAFVIADLAITCNKLPNSVELEKDYYKLLRASKGKFIFCYYETTNKYYNLSPQTDNYYWYNDLEDRDNCYFAQNIKVEGEPPHYIGELEWTEIPIDSMPQFNEIPYNDIIKNTLKSPMWYFTPQKGGEVTSTYWIYTNNEWVNVDDIGEPKIPIIYFNWYDGERFTGLDINSITLQVNDKKVDFIEVDNGHDDCRRQFIGYIDKSSTYSISLEKNESLSASLYYCSNFNKVGTTYINFDEMQKIANFTTTYEPIVITFESRPQL